MIAVETKDNCTIFRVSGEVTATDIAQHVVAHISNQPTDTALWDFSDAKRLKLSTVELKGLADSLKSVSADKKARSVALVGSSKINIGLGKLFIAFAQIAGLPNRYKVFRDMSQAMDWIKKQ